MLHHFDEIMQNLRKTKLIFEFKRWKFPNILATTGKQLRSRKGAGHPLDSVEENEAGMVEGEVGESVQVEERQIQMEEVRVQVEEVDLQQVVLLVEEEKEDLQVELLHFVVVWIPILGAHLEENYHGLFPSC